MSDAVIPSDAPDPTPSRPADRARFWRDAVAAFATSGQTVRAYCRARGLHEKRFYTWRRGLGLSPVTRPTPAMSVAAPARGFVPVRLVSDPTAEVALPGGVTAASSSAPHRRATQPTSLGSSPLSRSDVLTLGTTDTIDSGGAAWDIREGIDGSW